MSLDDELASLLARLGVELEEPEGPALGDPAGDRPEQTRAARLEYGVRGRRAAEGGDDEGGDDEGDASVAAVADVSLFQTSREHYGVFYRLDLVQGLPHLRIYMPEEEGALKVRCYLVRAAPRTPLHEWFTTAREHEGSPAYEDARDAAQQHLLFAAGELMKRLFWSGDVEGMRFPDEIAVCRVA